MHWLDRHGRLNDCNRARAGCVDCAADAGILGDCDDLPDSSTRGCEQERSRSANHHDRGRRFVASGWINLLFLYCVVLCFFASQSDRVGFCEFDCEMVEDSKRVTSIVTERASSDKSRGNASLRRRPFDMVACQERHWNENMGGSLRHVHSRQSPAMAAGMGGPEPTLQISMFYLCMCSQNVESKILRGRANTCLDFLSIFGYHGRIPLRIILCRLELVFAWTSSGMLCTLHLRSRLAVIAYVTSFLFLQSVQLAQSSFPPPGGPLLPICLALSISSHSNKLLAMPVALAMQFLSTLKLS